MKKKKAPEPKIYVEKTSKKAGDKKAIKCRIMPPQEIAVKIECPTPVRSK